MAGLTSSGLVIRTQPELRDMIRATIAEALPGINLDEGPEQQFIEIVAEKIAENWEALQALYGAAFGQGDGLLLDLFAAITGTARREATKSRVTATVNLNAGVTLPRGKVASVAGDPNAQFATVADVTNTSGVAANVSVVLEAVKTGPIAALAGTLTVIVTPSSGWNSITNATDAEKGRLVADDIELAAARLVELAGRGKDSYAAIRAAVSKVAGVISVTVYGNETIGTVSGRPGKSIEVVVWDDGAAADDDIAQAIYDTKPAGISSFGVGSSGTAKTGLQEDFTIDFTRATVLRTYVAATVVLGAGASAAQIKQALADRSALYVVAQLSYASQLVQAILDALSGVTAVTGLTVGTGSSPVTTLVTPTYAQIVRISTGDVAVTGAS
jgi:Baseplate J-like protein